MKYLLMLLLLLLLPSCAEFQTKMDEMNGLNCAPPIHSICEPNESLLICDSADKRSCQGWIIE